MVNGLVRTRSGRHGVGQAHPGRLAWCRRRASSGVASLGGQLRGPGAGCLGVVPVLAQVKVSPDSRALPGGAQLQQIVNGVAAFSLVILVGAVIAGAVMWAYGSATSSYNNINGGKRMVLISALGAVIVGGAAALINFFTAMGGQI